MTPIVVTSHLANRWLQQKIKRMLKYYISILTIIILSNSLEGQIVILNDFMDVLTKEIVAKNRIESVVLESRHGMPVFRKYKTDGQIETLLFEYSERDTAVIDFVYKDKILTNSIRIDNGIDTVFEIEYFYENSNLILEIVNYSKNESPELINYKYDDNHRLTELRTEQENNNSLSVNSMKFSYSNNQVHSKEERGVEIQSYNKDGFPYLVERIPVKGMEEYYTRLSGYRMKYKSNGLLKKVIYLGDEMGKGIVFNLKYTKYKKM